ncbi:MAG: hypothetical protein L6Q99_17945 [Planctomycetes bacterium]|nr:hypothetical protein [Planctomycetota bacterium]
MDALLEFFASIVHWGTEDPVVRRRRNWIFLAVFVATAAVIAYAMLAAD